MILYEMTDWKEAAKQIAVGAVLVSKADWGITEQTTDRGNENDLYKI